MFWRSLQKPTELAGLAGNVAVYGIWYKDIMAKLFDAPNASVGDAQWWGIALTMLVGGWAIERGAHAVRHNLHMGYGGVAAGGVKILAWGLEKGINLFNNTPFASTVSNFGLWYRHRSLEAELKKRSPMTDINKGAISSPPPDFGGGPSEGGGLLRRGVAAAILSERAGGAEDTWTLGGATEVPDEHKESVAVGPAAGTGEEDGSGAKARIRRLLKRERPPEPPDEE